MSRRNRLWHVAREAKTAQAYAGPEDDTDDDGGIDALPYLGPWCCADGQRLAVPVCPDCGRHVGGLSGSDGGGPWLSEGSCSPRP